MTAYRGDGALLWMRGGSRVQRCLRRTAAVTGLKYGARSRVLEITGVTAYEVRPTPVALVAETLLAVQSNKAEEQKPS